MSALSVRLPESLHDRVRELAAREGISINQLVATALAEKMAALMTEDFLEARARRGSRSKFLAALGHVPDVEPDPEDRLPAKASNRLHPPVGAKRQAQPKRKTRARRG
jgi:hypothetical protein